MSVIRNARKKGVSKPVRSPIRERGRVKHGEKPGIDFSSPIPDVPTVTRRVEYRTTQIPKYTVNPNTLNSLERLPSVSLVIEMVMPEDSDARNVTKLAVNPRVTSAMVACLEVIESELSTERNTGTENAMPITKSRDDGRKSGKKDERDRSMAWR